MSNYEEVEVELRNHPRKWLLTGVAGFIGSNLLIRLLELDQDVIGLDNLSTGSRANLDEVRALVGPAKWSRFRFVESSITSAEDCSLACEGRDFVLHQAALGSVPRSLKMPLASHAANVDGFINMLEAARVAGVKRFVYASSSSVYGSHPALPKVEENIGVPLSPYAATKAINEIYAGVFARCYDLQIIGLRYFNVFGPRQSPEGAYAAVIPKWLGSLLSGHDVYINGDGETSRDFCFIENVVQANLLAALASEEACDQVYNIAAGGRTTLNELFRMIRDNLVDHGVDPTVTPRFQGFREGDVRHSHADISKAQRLLGYSPVFDVRSGLRQATPWYVQNCSAKRKANG